MGHQIMFPGRGGPHSTRAAGSAWGGVGCSMTGFAGCAVTAGSCAVAIDRRGAAAFAGGAAADDARAARRPLRDTDGGLMAMHGKV